MLKKNSIKLHYPKSFIIGEFAIGVYDKVNLYAFLTDYPSEYYPGIPYEECLLSKDREFRGNVKP